VLSQVALCEQSQGAIAQYTDPFTVDDRAPRSHEVVSQLVDIDTPQPGEVGKRPMVVEEKCVEVPWTQPQSALQPAHVEWDPVPCHPRLVREPSVRRAGWRQGVVGLHGQWRSHREAHGKSRRSRRARQHTHAPIVTEARLANHRLSASGPMAKAPR
jgi:hypothetical protein